MSDPAPPPSPSPSPSPSPPQLPGIAGEAVDVPGAPLGFEVGEALDGGWRAIKTYGGTLVAAHVIAALPGAVAGAALRIGLGDARFGSHAYWTRAAIGFALGELFSAAFRAGLLRMAVAAARSQPPRLTELARGARSFGVMLLFEVIGLALLVVSAPLLFMPGVWAWLGLAMAPYFYVDGGIGGMTLRESFRASWQAARGERMHLLGFFVAAEVVTYLGLMACCVGSLVAVPLVSVATAHVYLRLAGERPTEMVRID